jgi:hypothetical protein
MRRGKRAGLQRMQLPPGNWFAPTGTNQSGSGFVQIAVILNDQRSKREIVLITTATESVVESWYAGNDSQS